MKLFAVIQLRSRTEFACDISYCMPHLLALWWASTLDVGKTASLQVTSNIKLRDFPTVACIKFLMICVTTVSAAGFRRYQDLRWSDQRAMLVTQVLNDWHQSSEPQLQLQHRHCTLAVTSMTVSTMKITRMKSWNVQPYNPSELALLFTRLTVMNL
jgi:hypothetical protein